LFPAPRRTRRHPAKGDEILHHGGRSDADMSGDGAIGGVLAQLVKRFKNGRLQLEMTLTPGLTPAGTAGSSQADIPSTPARRVSRPRFCTAPGGHTKIVLATAPGDLFNLLDFSLQPARFRNPNHYQACGLDLPCHECLPLFIA
jgi:hypothetical protein